jgi:hypothetical protein
MRTLVEDPDKKLIKSLQNYSKTFMRDFGHRMITNNDEMNDDEYIRTRNWPLGKKQQWINTPEELENRYSSTLFIKKECVYKSKLKAGRTICAPSKWPKRYFGKYVASTVHGLKPHLKYGSEYNKNSNHINLIWTSSMNRDQVGEQYHKIKDFTKTRPKEDYIIVYTDYSKFEATQITPIISTLNHIYRNVTSGETRRRLSLLNKLVSGKKTAYYSEDKDGIFGLFKFFGTRTSGDMTTTLGNTLLGMMIGDFFFRDLTKAQKKLIYLWQAGDDGCFILPRRFLKYIDTTFITKIGMKLDVGVVEQPYLMDYNSSFIITVMREGTMTYQLVAKPGRVMAKAGYTYREYPRRQMNAMRYQKALGAANELQHLPGVQQFYLRLAQKYIKHKDVKIYTQHKTLRTVVPYDMCDVGISELCERYDISRSDYDLLNDTYSKFSTDIIYITENVGYFKIRHIMNKIMLTDVVEYSNEDIDSFNDYFNHDFMQIYIENFAGTQ